MEAWSKVKQMKKQEEYRILASCQEKPQAAKITSNRQGIRDKKPYVSVSSTKFKQYSNDNGASYAIYQIINYLIHCISNLSKSPAFPPVLAFGNTC